jgi:hypothetical protein
MHFTLSISSNAYRVVRSGMRHVTHKQSQIQRFFFACLYELCG